MLTPLQEIGFSESKVSTRPTPPTSQVALPLRPGQVSRPHRRADTKALWREAGCEACAGNRRQNCADRGAEARNIDLRQRGGGLQRRRRRRRRLPSAAALAAGADGGASAARGAWRSASAPTETKAVTTAAVTSTTADAMGATPRGLLDGRL
ncbi:unnamed protein product, partial [Phaeothamnion confervicola]